LYDTKSSDHVNKFKIHIKLFQLHGSGFQVHKHHFHSTSVELTQVCVPGFISDIGNSDEALIFIAFQNL